MDGVFINLTKDDIHLILNDKTINIPANIDLMTPVSKTLYTENTIHGIISSTLNDDDIRYLKGTNWINTVYNKITRSEEEIKIPTLYTSPFVKYPFTKDQIDKINRISNRRTRLLILNKEEAEYWSNGKFDCPFRNYRLFSYTGNQLIEYPIPKTYLDSFVESVKNISDRVYN